MRFRRGRRGGRRFYGRRRRSSSRGRRRARFGQRSLARRVGIRM